MLIINADELPRFMTCNGSRLLPGVIPATTRDTTARDEGTAAHYMATSVYRGNVTLEELVDHKAPNGIYMTVEMAGHVASYLEVLKQHQRLLDTFIGVELDTSHDNSPLWAVNGRTDFIGLIDDKTFRVIDFKYGWRIVEPEMNWTLISHAIGFISQYNFNPEKIVFSIFQPRPWHPDGPLRSWEITADKLRELKNLLNLTLTAPSDTLRTSNYCTNCKAVTTCPASRMMQNTAVDWIEDHAYSDEIDNEQLKFQLDTLYRIQDALKDRLKAMEELAQHRIKAGQIVDGYAVEMGFHNTTWNEGITADILKALTGLDLAAQPKLVTPAEAKRRGVPKELIPTLTERLPSGIKLVRADANKRATRLFKQQEG